MRHWKPVAVVLAVLLLGASTPARAKDLLDYVIEAVDPTLAPARPLIECLAGGGAAEQCAVEAAKKQAAGALPIGPGDDRVQKAVKVFAAARDERWLDVLKIGGEVVAKSVSCAVLPVQGPLKGTACGIVGWVISKNAGALDKAYQALKGPDWWALVELLGPGVCEMIPGDGPAGLARDVLCGPLAQVLLELKQWADAVGKGAVGGADALENLVFGDDSHMPYHRYFALYWQPWYHYSTARVFMGEGTGPAVAHAYDRCVDYFDSHNQYRSTARKTCGDLRNKFGKHVQGFAAALPVAVESYFETVARPAIRTAATLSYGKPAPLPAPRRGLLRAELRVPDAHPRPVPGAERGPLHGARRQGQEGRQGGDARDGTAARVHGRRLLQGREGAGPAAERLGAGLRGHAAALRPGLRGRDPQAGQGDRRPEEGGLCSSRSAARQVRA